MNSVNRAYNNDRVRQLKALGFDLSKSLRSGGRVVRCSQCVAAVVNGTPIHEEYCPNMKHECKGCNDLLPMNQTWCKECAQ